MFLKVFCSVLRVGPESGGKYCRDQQESACRPEVLFPASDSIPWQTGCSLPTLEFWGRGEEYEVKNTLCEISPCCVIREWCSDSRECIFLFLFGGVLDFKVEVQGCFRAQGCALRTMLAVYEHFPALTFILEVGKPSPFKISLGPLFS